MSSRGTLYRDEQSEPLEVATWREYRMRRRKRNLFLQSLQDEETQSMGLTGGTGGKKNESWREYRDEDIIENLETTIEFWTDYSKEFGNYGTGRDVYSEGLRGEEIIERLRFFVEECDHIQGFQFIVDESGGFSAIAAGFLENVSDDYSNTNFAL